MFLKVKGFMHGDPIIVNADRVIRVTGMKEQVGCVFTMEDGSKLTAKNTLDEVFEALGSWREENTYDLTEAEDPEDGPVHSGAV